ncbi:MAG: transporter associated domain-containing protein [Alphaproteobacteria bacterium]
MKPKKWRNFWKLCKKLLGGSHKLEHRNSTEPEISSEEGELEKPFETFLKKIEALTVGDVMVPRADLIAVSKEDTLEEVLGRFLQARAQALPVFRSNLDDIIGMISVHDILSLLAQKSTEPWARKLSSVSFVPASMPALEAFLALSDQRAPFVLIVDEHGGVDGLASQKALLKALGSQFGLWEEETEILETVEWSEQKGSCLIDGRLPLEAFEEEFNISLQLSEREENIETVGGLVCSLAGRVPLVKEIITHPKGMTFEILDADSRRIKRMAVFLPKRH